MHERAGYGIESDVVARRLGTDRATGLSVPEAARRLIVDGPNELAETPSKHVSVVAWKRATATMVMILILPVMILATLGDYIDAGVIVIFVGLNAVVGFHYAFRATKANAVLRLAVARVRVRREGCLREIAARELVVGDMMLLEAGNVVAADGLLMDAESLRTQEAALTGELRPVDKAPAPSQAQAVRASVAAGHGNMVFMGTTVTHGCGHALVTDTGMRTVKGKAAKLSQTVQQVPAAVQAGLDHLVGRLALVALALVCVMFALSLVLSEVGVLFLAAVSMAEAAVPEGLLAVVTIALALGGQRMLPGHLKRPS